MEFNSYDTIEQYVKDYQACKEGAAEKLLNAFRGFIMKFYGLICLNQFDIKDKDQRHFVRLFFPPGSLSFRNVDKYQRMPSVRNDLNRAIAPMRLHYRMYEPEDIENELSLAFLTLAKRYDTTQERQTFAMYVQRVFKFEFFRQTTQKSIMNYTLFNDEEFDGDNYLNIDEIVDDSQTILIGEFYEDELDDNWIYGAIGSDYFRELKIIDRKILAWYYDQDMNDQQIANKLGLSRATINRRRLFIKDRIRTAAIENKQIDS